MNSPQLIKKQPCPMCMKSTLTLTEADREIPYFGLVYIFAMDCENPECSYHKADIEIANKGEPTKWSLDITKEEDMKIRVVKSSEATVRLPRIMNIDPGPASNGYVTNIEGILNRAKVMLEKVRDDSEDSDDRKKARI